MSDAAELRAEIARVADTLSEVEGSVRNLDVATKRNTDSNETLRDAKANLAKWTRRGFYAVLVVILLAVGAGLRNEQLEDQRIRREEAAAAKRRTEVRCAVIGSEARSSAAIVNGLRQVVPSEPEAVAVIEASLREALAETANEIPVDCGTDFGLTRCADGWLSASTGPGTCSHHGGQADD